MARGEEYYDEEELEAALGRGGGEEEAGRSRVLAVLGSSYGVSFLVHAAVLLLLATIIIAMPPTREVAALRITPSPPVPDKPLLEERALEEAPEIPVEVVSPEPIVELVEQPEPVEVPAGTLDAASNKDQRDVSYRDVLGPGGPPAGLQGRIGRKRAHGQPGGSDPRSRLVDAALRWLAAHQAPDGRWDCDGWQGQCSRGRCSGPGVDTGGSEYDLGVTALALLAFLGDGQTHRWGTFKRTVNGAVRRLVAEQARDGSIGLHGGGHGGMYCHAIATLALAEAYHLTRDFTLRAPAQRAVDFCLAAQNPGLAWKYDVRGGRNDTSVTGWMVLALKAARVAGLAVSAEAFEGARRWLERATDARGEAGYESPGGGSSVLPANDGKFAPLPVMTAVAVAGRVFLGESVRSGPVEAGSRLLDEALPAWEPSRINYYYWYYGSYAQFHAGGRRWAAWNEAILAALSGTQRTDGCADGSWDGVGEWCLAGGRIYATAMSALTLQVVYRYARGESALAGAEAPR